MNERAPPPGDLGGPPPGILEEGERAVWIGRPARAHKFGMIEIGGVFGTCAPMLLITSLAEAVGRSSVTLAVIEVSLWLAVLYMVVVRFVVVGLAARRLGFVLSNRRAIIYNTGTAKVMGAAWLAQQVAIETDKRKSGIGTVAVGHRGMAGAAFFRLTGIVWPWLMEGGVFFYEVPDADALADRIRDGIASIFD